MRYYKFALKTNSEEIKTIIKQNNLRNEIGYYDTEVGALNGYMVKKIENNVTFLCYREENDMLFCQFSFDEQKMEYGDTYEGILKIIRKPFGNIPVAVSPQEITSLEYGENIREGRRKDHISYSQRIVDTAHLYLFNYDTIDSKDKNFEYNERIISSERIDCHGMYDDKFRRELSNIENHVNNFDYSGNMVHYVISSKSNAVAEDMTEVLMQRLLAARRLSSRRMGIFTDIRERLYKGNNFFEDLINSNAGGVMVINLTELFGTNVSHYVSTSEYILKILKKYHNKCLFIFTYNMDNPGFAYQILPHLGKYVIPVTLNEGKGDRKAAVSYMKKLIESSELAEYSSQAGEYMKNYPGDSFSQTDVIEAFDKFESCLNKNVFKAYDLDLDGSFYMARDEEKETSYNKLKNLIGLDIVKKEVDTIIAADTVEKARKKKSNLYQTKSMHMVFAGNPGSAKTTVARLFAGIAKEKGILKSGAFVQCEGNNLSPEEVRDAFTAAKGGVLFIDEAYAIPYNGAITALLQGMENYRDEVIVIVAGYSDNMKGFMDRNVGLKSRIPYWIEFPDYTPSELLTILEYMAREQGFTLTEEAKAEALYIFEKAVYIDDFGNGRYARNLFEKATEKQAVRLLTAGKSADKISEKKLFTLIKEDIVMPGDGTKKERPKGTAQKELQNMVGLDSVKEVIHKAIANYKFNRMCLDRGMNRKKASLHMVFTGNPGTSKTTVARLFAEILKDEKVLPTGNFLETGRADLVSPIANLTPVLVQEKFREARGGVLFIDEAYSLCDNCRNGAGDEAINTIVQEMENHRDDVIVIFAGYPEPMKEFLDRNPGMSSRIAFKVHFEDYSVDELYEITKLMVSKKGMKITEQALDKLRKIYVKVDKKEDFGNGRFVRKVLEEVEMNLANRLLDKDESLITDEILTTLEECDIPDNIDEPATSFKLGFAS